MLTGRQARVLRFMTKAKGRTAFPPDMLADLYEILSTDYVTINLLPLAYDALAQYEREASHGARLTRGMSAAGRAALQGERNADA